MLFSTEAIPFYIAHGATQGLHFLLVLTSSRSVPLFK